VKESMPPSLRLDQCGVLEACAELARRHGPNSACALTAEAGNGGKRRQERQTARIYIYTIC